MNRVAHIVVFVLFLSLTSCLRTGIESSLVKLPAESGWSDTIRLDLRLEDTLSAYKLNFYLQFSSDLDYSRDKEFGAKFLFLAPDSTLYQDELDFPIYMVKDKKYVDYRNGVLSMKWCYRKNIFIKKPGEWILSVIPLNPSDNSIFRKVTAVGISAEKM